jgi:hypothetical protein
MLCNGNHSEFCGGSSRLGVYDYKNDVSLPPYTSTSTSPTSSVSLPVQPTTSQSATLVSSSALSPVSSSPAAAAPSLGLKNEVGTYSFLGCYTEATNGRALSAASFYDYTAMTLEDCAADCASHTYFGVEYGGECSLHLFSLLNIH